MSLLFQAGDPVQSRSSTHVCEIRLQEHLHVIALRPRPAGELPAVRVAGVTVMRADPASPADAGEGAARRGGGGRGGRQQQGGGGGTGEGVVVCSSPVKHIVHVQRETGGRGPWQHRGAPQLLRGAGRHRRGDEERS